MDCHYDMIGTSEDKGFANNVDIYCLQSPIFVLFFQATTDLQMSLLPIMIKKIDGVMASAFGHSALGLKEPMSHCIHSPEISPCLKKKTKAVSDSAFSLSYKNYSDDPR